MRILLKSGHYVTEANVDIILQRQEWALCNREISEHYSTEQTAVFFRANGNGNYPTEK